MVEAIILVLVMLGCVTHWLWSERRQYRKHIIELETELDDTRFALKEKNIADIEDKLYALRLKKKLEEEGKI